MIFTPTELRKRLKSQPFDPVQIVTTTGQTYDVYHPDLVLVSQNFIEVGIPSFDDPLVAGQVTRVALIHIVELKDLPRRLPATPTN